MEQEGNEKDTEMFAKKIFLNIKKLMTKHEEDMNREQKSINKNRCNTFDNYQKYPRQGRKINLLKSGKWCSHAKE